MMRSAPVTAAATPLTISPRGSNELPRALPPVSTGGFLNSGSNVHLHDSFPALGRIRRSGLTESMSVVHLSTPVPAMINDISHARMDLPMETLTLPETVELDGVSRQLWKREVDGADERTLMLGREDLYGPPPPEAHIPKAKAGFESHHPYMSRIPVIATATEEEDYDEKPSVHAHVSDENHKQKKSLLVENQSIITATSAPSNPFTTKFQNFWNTCIKTLRFSSTTSTNKAILGEKISQAPISKKFWKWDMYTRAHTKPGEKNDQSYSENAEKHEAAVQECTIGGKSWWDVPVAPVVLGENNPTQDAFYNNVNILDQSRLMNLEKETEGSENFEEVKAYGGFNKPALKHRGRNVTSVELYNRGLPMENTARFSRLDGGIENAEHGAVSKLGSQNNDSGSTCHEESTLEQTMSQPETTQEPRQNDRTEGTVEPTITEWASTEPNKELCGSTSQLELANETGMKNPVDTADDGASAGEKRKGPKEEEEEPCWVHRWLASYSAQEQ